MTDKDFLMGIILISVCISGLTVILQFSRKKYREAFFSLLFTLSFFGFFMGIFLEFRLISYISLAIIVPVVICQAVFAMIDLKKHKIAEASGK